MVDLPGLEARPVEGGLRGLLAQRDGPVHEVAVPLLEPLPLEVVLARKGGVAPVDARVRKNLEQPEQLVVAGVDAPGDLHGLLLGHHMRRQNGGEGGNGDHVMMVREEPPGCR